MKHELVSQVVDIPNFTHPDVVSALVWLRAAIFCICVLTVCDNSCSQKETTVPAEWSTLTAQNQVSTGAVNLN